MARNIKGPWVCPCEQNEQLLIRCVSSLNGCVASAVLCDIHIADLVRQRFELLKKRKPTGTFSEQDLDERILKQQQEEEERKRQRRERKKEKKKEKAAEEEPEVDPDVAAMMGFGGFRSSKK